VASGVGNSLYADSVTEEQLRLGYARVLVEVNVDSEFPKEIDLDMGKGKSITVGV
jgi:predicted GNAT superfamily acetyltransferase